jgi:hypothetical protein
MMDWGTTVAMGCDMVDWDTTVVIGLRYDGLGYDSGYGAAI